jgi:hypothetical protein
MIFDDAWAPRQNVYDYFLRSLIDSSPRPPNMSAISSEQPAPAPPEISTAGGRGQRTLFIYGADS